MTMITSGYGRNAYNTGAWNENTVNQSISVSRAGALASTVRSVLISVDGAHSVAGNSLTANLRSVSIAVDSSLNVTGIATTLGLRNVSVAVVKQVNPTRIPIGISLRSATITVGSAIKPTGISTSLTLREAFASTGPYAIATGVSLTGALGTASPQAGAEVVYYPAKTFKVTVSGSKFYIDGKLQYGLNLVKGRTLYVFDQSDSSNSGHPLRLSLTNNGTHSGGSPFTTNVATEGTPGNSGAYTSIFVVNSGPTELYYYCSEHSGMGGALTFLPIPSFNVVTPSVNGDGNLVITGVSMRIRTRIRGIWTPKIFGGTSEVWKAKRT